MKIIYPSLAIANTIILFLLVSINFSNAQTLQAGAADESTGVTTGVVNVMEDVAEITLSVTGATKVMVIANFETDVTTGNSAMTATYQLTDGTNTSAEIQRYVVAKAYDDYGLGTVVHIFSYPTNTEVSRTFSLQHMRPESGANKVFSSKANMVAIVIDDDDNSLPNSVKATSDVATEDANFVEVAGSKTDGIVLTKPGGIYISAAFSTFGSEDLTGTWVLRSSTNGTDWTEVAGATMSRTNTTAIGAATSTWLFEDQPAGTYYYDVAHKTTTGTLTTRNLTLIAVGLVDTNGNTFPTYKTTGGSGATTSSSAVIAHSTSAIVSENDANSLFAHATFSMSASAIITAPEFSFGITNSTFSPISFRRYIPAGETGSGGLVGLATITNVDVPVVSLYHQSDGTSELTTSNINLVGFQLKSSPSFATTGNGDWNTTTTWNPATIPTASNTVVLNHAITIAATGTADVYNLTTTAGSSLTITSDVSSSGSLIVAGTLTGNITYERWMTGVDKWHLISAPVTNQDIGDLLLNITATNSITNSGSNYAMSDYSENLDVFNSFFESSVAGNFVSGKGYQTMRSIAGTVSFTGALQSADVAGISITRINFGWNLLGNPYPSAINATTTADATNNLLSTANVAKLDASYAALYLWDSGTGAYQTISNAGDAFPSSSNLVQNYIQTGQGFFVKAISSQTFDITEAMQSHQPSVAFKSEELSWPTINLKAETETANSSTVITFNSEMTRGLDISYDAGMFKSNPNFALYSRLVEDNGVDFAIQCLPEEYDDLVIPIGLDATIGDYVTFSAEIYNLPADASCYLENRAAGTFTPLSAIGSTYSVDITAENAVVGTFFLHPNFKIGLSNQEQIQVHHKFITNQPEGYLRIIGTVESNSIARVYDIAGRLQAEILLQNNQDNLLYLNNLNRGIYLLQIQNGNEVIREKIFW